MQRQAAAPAAADGPDRQVLVVDVANVMGSRPDGWWRDRPGAAARLLQQLVERPGPIVAVLEGQAKAAAVPTAEHLRVVLAATDGDTAVVREAERLLAAGLAPLVVTADRGLRDRLPSGVEVAGPRWLLDQLPD